MNLYQIFKDGQPITGALTYREGLQKLASFKRSDGENAAAYTLETWMPKRAKAAEEASELAGLATIEGSLEDGELTNHGSVTVEGSEAQRTHVAPDTKATVYDGEHELATFNYWEDAEAYYASLAAASFGANYTVKLHSSQEG